MIKNRVGIDERPEIVDQKTRMGDWEGEPSSARITKVDWLPWLKGSRAMCWRGTYAVNMPRV
ncbi:hypothetical protein W01_05210 [Candidatus Nitrotoga sp. AM1P]|uniref:hypothetical protein n=1 Tax=Candidatus Nitrotoga sp. AM1P TaxID=2559597 RepID=UPI0010B34620|nr:hypothetical protein [Candidatus Nitrotoga sp. AM1P]BBJ22594.1 hypothetical protein W01_05210 [Candidatus Nitrotoga sp. AM1P]